ncbi:MAG: hypothetical protein SFV51_00610 [Bryobacteraceae bacterium]|nr:hypothetical protein [Bryobacteraceae bacterium]
MKVLLLTLLLFAPAHAATFDLRFDRLADALGLLPTSDRSAVDSVIDLIKKGDHQTALTRLNDLNRSNPDNSSLRLLTSYAMLELGNLLGAYEEAHRAHDAENGNSYKCWFYSKLAFLNGDKTVCKRELNHVKKAGDMPAEVKALEKELKSKKS